MGYLLVSLFIKDFFYVPLSLPIRDAILEIITLKPQSSSFHSVPIYVYGCIKSMTFLFPKHR